MTTPNQHLQEFREAAKQITHERAAKGYPNVAEDTDALTKAAAKAMIGMLGEDEPTDIWDREEQCRRVARNGLRASIRKQLAQVVKEDKTNDTTE